MVMVNVAAWLVWGMWVGGVHYWWLVLVKDVGFRVGHTGMLGLVGQGGWWAGYN